MKRTLLTTAGLTSTVVLLTALASPVLAQAAEQKAVQTFVESFLLHLGDHQLDAVANDLAPNALVVVTRQRPRRAQGVVSLSNHETASGRTAIRPARNGSPR